MTERIRHGQRLWEIWRQVKSAVGLEGWASWAEIKSQSCVVTAVFLLTILQRVWNGPLEPKWSGLADGSMPERFIVAPVIVMMFLLGASPQLVLNWINPTVLQIVERFRP